MPSPYEKAKTELNEMKAAMTPPTCDWGSIYDQLFEIEQMTGPNLDGSPLTLEQFEQRPDGQGGVMGGKQEFIARKTLEFRRKNDPHFNG